MPWRDAVEVKEFLKNKGLISILRDCPDCGVKPGQSHEEGCDVERCTVCGGQYISCPCEGSIQHDPDFARWTGIYPGYAEMLALGRVSEMGGSYVPDMNGMIMGGLHKIFFVKPVDAPTTEDE